MEEEDVLGEGGSERWSMVKRADAHALAAFVVAVLSLAGLGLLNGSAYLTNTVTDGGMSPAFVFSGAALGAAFAALPVLLGLHAHQRLPSDGIPALLALAAVHLGGLSVMLRLAVGVTAALGGAERYIRF